MIIFSQGETSHSRLGNSLVWMMKARPHLKSMGIDSVFPWAVEKFGNYLEAGSFWMRNPENISELFQFYFNSEFNALNVSNEARMIEHNYEVARGLKIDSDKLELSIFDGRVLYLTGFIDFSSPETAKMIEGHELTICHEPYDYRYADDSILESVDYSDCGPSKKLATEQRELVEKLANGRKSVGLHIRRGDYLFWENSDYFYEDDFWLELAKAEFLQGHAVFVFSNELSGDLRDRLEQLGCFIIAGSFEVDFTQLMFMNHVVGPPSTFTYMANLISTRLLGNSVTHAFLPKKHNLVGINHVKCC
jgi:hypothetical protein